MAAWAELARLAARTSKGTICLGFMFCFFIGFNFFGALMGGCLAQPRIGGNCATRARTCACRAQGVRFWIFDFCFGGVTLAHRGGRGARTFVSMVTCSKHLLNGARPRRT